MRDWYKQYLEKKGGTQRRVAPFYWLIALNIIFVFYFLSQRENSLFEYPEAKILTEKLTSVNAEKNRVDSIVSFETPERIQYMLQFTLTNQSVSGEVEVWGSLKREDTLIQSKKIIFIEEGDTISDKLIFDEIEYKDLKRDYLLTVEAVEINK